MFHPFNFYDVINIIYSYKREEYIFCSDPSYRVAILLLVEMCGRGPEDLYLEKSRRFVTLDKAHS